MLDKICHQCFTPFYSKESFDRFKRCSCGVQRVNKEIISLIDILTSSGKYPDRANSPECTTEVKDNAVLLINKVNQMLEELGIEKVSVSSGFRTSAANSALANSAKKSNHMLGKAVDIVDHNHELANKILARPDLLKKYSIWAESIESTPTWVHLDDAVRSDRPIRTFKP